MTQIKVDRFERKVRFVVGRSIVYESLDDARDLARAIEAVCVELARMPPDGWVPCDAEPPIGMRVCMLTPLSKEWRYGNVVEWGERRRFDDEPLCIAVKWDTGTTGAPDWPEFFVERSRA